MTAAARTSHTPQARISNAHAVASSPGTLLFLEMLMILVTQTRNPQEFESTNKSGNIDDMGCSNRISARIQQIILEGVCYCSIVPAARTVAMQKHSQLHLGIATEVDTCDGTSPNNSRTKSVLSLLRQILIIIECLSDKWLRPGGRAQELESVGSQRVHMRRFQNLHCQTMGVP